MSLKKIIILSVIIFILIAIIILIMLGCSNMPPEKALNKFLKQIEKGNIDDISLTIYYLNPNILTFLALDVNGLIDYAQTEKFVIDGVQLTEEAEHIDLFKQIGSVTLVPYVHEDSLLNARIYYVFKNKNSKIFDVTMWGGWDEISIYINGKEFKMNDIFIDIIISFLPEYAAENLEKFKQHEGKFR